MSKTSANARGGVLPQFDLDIPMPPGAAVPRSATRREVRPSNLPLVKLGGAYRLMDNREAIRPRDRRAGEQVRSPEREQPLSTETPTQGQNVPPPSEPEDGA